MLALDIMSKKSEFADVNFTISAKGFKWPDAQAHIGTRIYISDEVYVYATLGCLHPIRACVHRLSILLTLIVLHSFNQYG